MLDLGSQPHKDTTDHRFIAQYKKKKISIYSLQYVIKYEFYYKINLLNCLLLDTNGAIVVTFDNFSYILLDFRSGQIFVGICIKI